MDQSKVLKKLKILFVEDETITRKQIYRFLSKKVGKVITAECGHDGIKKFHEYNPDIIITDLIMPDINGIEMMKNLREDGVQCPFIITSALSDSKTILETVDLKIEKYLVKPIDIEELIESLTKLAITILEKREDFLVVNKELILTESKKNELELEIRNIYSKYLKEVTGKGARVINVFIRGREIEILLKDNLTTLENTLLSTGNYHSGISFVRKIIYENTINKVEDQIKLLIDRKVQVREINIHSKEKFERVLFDII